MKSVKINITIAVVAIIGFFVTKWLININHPNNIDLPTNQYIQRIESEIDSLKRIKYNVFCQKYYHNIQYRIDDYFKNGFLGKNKNDNNQWHDILSKNLYTEYALKFVEQAQFVFSHSECRNDDINCIRSELIMLSSSPYLGKTGLVTTFNSIKAILAKYDEINNFIIACNRYTYSNYELNSTFPDLSNMIQKSKAYLANKLDNSYVNNCTRLKNCLQQIPKILFDKHIRYLKKKIKENGTRYNEISMQPDYSSTIYTPLNDQLNDINNDIYGINENVFNKAYKSVNNLLDYYNREAYNYYKNKRKNN
ncbi:MAG: hypothetical protein QM535_22320 [Limnohabitans sp.]|nr:hypothetical protein [Limnohabitans sp.]